MRQIDARRRGLLKTGGLAAVFFALGLRGAASRGQEHKPRLDENEAQAVQLGYRHDAATVDKKKFPTYKPGEACEKCQFFQSKSASEEWAPCSMFPGKQVNANGWCSSYMKRTS